MKFTRKSLALLALLILSVIFLGGFRLGRTVEKADKNFVPPTKIPTATPLASPTLPPLQLKTFTHPCGVSFSYPASIPENRNSSNAAILKDGTQSIEIECEKIASNSGNITAKVEGITPIPHKDDITTWQVRNPKTRQVVSFSVSKNLVELVLKTLKLQ
jgi:hypothetical protein